MIRPFTLLTAVIFLLSGAYMFAIKHRAEATEVRIAQIDQQSRLDAGRIRVLQAQWALETDPDRLSQLAATFTNLTPMKPAQLVTLAALRDELPPPDSAAPVGVVAPQLVTPAPVALAPPATARPSLPLPPPIAPLRVAIAGSSPALPHPVSHSLLHLANTKAAETLAPPRIFSPQSPPAGQLAPQYVAMKAAPVDSGSVLGMAADLAPPRPLPQGIGN